MTGAPRAICSAISETFTSRSSIAAGRSARNTPSRLTLGSRLRRRCCRAWCSSVTISAKPSTMARVKPYGLAMKTAQPRADRPGKAARLTVSRLVGASPVNALLIDTPPSRSSPAPLDRRVSISAASRGRLATTIRCWALSYHR